MMLRIKRLYLYVLQEFLPMFFATFAILLFILLMQFLWKYVEDLVGKGLETLVLAELFLYATLSIIPLALPLSILLSSLMTFGNLGERFELTAIKAAGISLFRIMRPLMIFIMLVCVGAFYFQNEAMPVINVKTASLLKSVKMKSPELDIPEGSFYNEIENYNLFVKEKDKETGVLRDVIIYDTSEGFDQMRIIVCDSAKMRTSSNKDYLLLILYHGQQFVNFQQQSNATRTARENKFVPYSRENFREKEIIIPFDANFNRMDESSLESAQYAKNIEQLQTSIDSLTTIVDSLDRIDRVIVLNQSYKAASVLRDTSFVVKDDTPQKLKFDSIINSLDTESKVSLYSNAIAQTEMNRNDLLYRSMNKMSANSEIRYHKVEWHRKFTLSFACLIFFFIGAPLGAIIRKGGLGMPVVISVVLFIVYYIIDNVGRKMGRDGVWDAWQGIWLSSFILFPLGVFLTYKAMNDSALFNTDAYRNLYIKLIGNLKSKTLMQLFKAFANNIKYILILYIVVILSVVGKVSVLGMLGSVSNIVLWISLISYLALFIKSCIEYKAFYGLAKKELKIKNIVLLFILGVLLPFVMLFLVKAKMQGILDVQNELMEENRNG